MTQTLALNRNQYLELEKIALGAFAPLDGFMNEAQFRTDRTRTATASAECTLRISESPASSISASNSTIVPGAARSIETLCSTEAEASTISFPYVRKTPSVVPTPVGTSTSP